MRARIRDTEIYFDVEGAGLVPDGARMVEKPACFVIHGGPGPDHTGYKPAFSALAEKMQLVYFDHRGQGRSARGPVESYTLENNVEDMEALRQYLGLERIVVLGASYGGMVALSYACRYPQHVSHLIAVATSPDHRFLARAREIVAERGTPEQIAACEPLWAGSFGSEAELRAYFEVMGPMYALKHDPVAARESGDRRIMNVDAINVAFGGFLRSYTVLDDLHKITAPTLVIGAAHDWICAPELSELIASTIPGAELRMFQNSGHVVWQDELSAFIDAVGVFVTGG